MIFSACCKAQIVEQKRIAEDEIPYGIPREVLCCSNCGAENPEFVRVMEFKRINNQVEQ